MTAAISAAVAAVATLPAAMTGVMVVTAERRLLRGLRLSMAAVAVEQTAIQRELAALAAEEMRPTEA